MPQRMICPLCGERYEAGATKCRFCGVASDYRDPRDDPAKGIWGELLLLGFMFVLFVGLSVLFVWL